MEEIYEEINNLVQALLVPARVEKRIDNDVFEKFCSILEELEKDMKGKEVIPRKIAGILYFIDISLSAEIEHFHYKDDIFMAVSRIEGMISKILWESPFSI